MVTQAALLPVMRAAVGFDPAIETATALRFAREVGLTISTTEHAGNAAGQAGDVMNFDVSPLLNEVISDAGSFRWFPHPAQGALVDVHAWISDTSEFGKTCSLDPSCLVRFQSAHKYAVTCYPRTP